MEDVQTSATVSDAREHEERRAMEVEEQEAPKHNKNLDILQAYISQQRTLLDRIKGDIDRLNTSKQSIIQDAKSSFKQTNQPTDKELSGPKKLGLLACGDLTKINSLVAEVQRTGDITEKLDWSKFSGLDVSPLRALSSPEMTRQKDAASLQTQCPDSSLSALVGLIPERRPPPSKVSMRCLQIRELRASMVDPVLARSNEVIASLSVKIEDAQSKVLKADTSLTAPKVPRPPRTSDAKGHSKRNKAAQRKKGDIVSPATARPRGHGGRFLKLNQQIGKTLPYTAPPLSAISAKSIPESFSVTSSPSTSTLPQSLPSATSLVNLEESEHGSLLQRNQRSRRPPSRYLSPSASVISAGSISTGRSRARSSISSGSRTSQSASPVVEVQPRLTIRIPARTTIRPPPPESVLPPPTISTGSNSANTSSTGSTISGSATATGERNSYSPATTVRSMSSIRAIVVKQEDEDGDCMMDADNAYDNGVKQEDTQDAVFGNKISMKSVSLIAKEEGDEGDDPDSDDSFVCKPLPPEIIDPLIAKQEESSYGLMRITSSSSSVPMNRSKTFNQTWSDEEQRLLDILLERYPDGTKNRWSKISKDMDGRRTPRQVASRVQKYFAKMKKWGIDVK